MIENTFIYLFGFAGAGKLTVARAIQRHLPCILVDNHLVNNVIFSLVDPDGKTRLPPAVWENISRVRAAVFDTIRDLSKPGRNFIFTNELIQEEAKCDTTFAEVARLSADRHAYLFPVRLLVDREELVRRVASPERIPLFKEIDVEAAYRKATEREVYRPRDGYYFELDITHLSPDESAGRIIEQMEKKTRQGAYL